MSAVQRSSTALVEERNRLSYWIAGSVLIGGIQARQIGAGAFNARVATRQMGSLIVYGLEAGPHRVAWSRNSCDRSREIFLRVRFQRTGSSIIEMNGHRIRTRAGEWSVIDGSVPHAIANEENASNISLQIPRSQLSDREFEAARRMRGPYPTAGGISHLLYQCLRLAIEDLDEARDSTDQELGASMLDVFRIILNDHMWSQTRTTMRETAEGRIRAFIRRNLTNPDLSVEMIADAMKCSRRYVHKLFEGGETVSQYIWSQRLEKCHRYLSEDEGRKKTLTELAFEYGFRSSAHFSRAFRARYGETPSEFRSRAVKPQVHEA